MSRRDREENEFPTKIRYEYEQDPQTRIRYAHGVWGGVNPQGEIEVNFYVESDKMPSYSECLIAPDGSLGHENIPFDEEARAVVRTVHSRIILNYHAARAVLEWLEDKVASLEEEEGSAPVLYEDNSGIEQ
jgi:hypothetical protein